MRLSLRLVDGEGYIWANRDWQIARNAIHGVDSQQIGLLIPAGVPPGLYDLVMGVGPDADDPWLFPVQMDGKRVETVPITPLEIVPSTVLPTPLRLPILHPLPQPVERDGMAFWGSAGYRADAPILAGTELDLSLFLQSMAGDLPDYQLYVSLLDADGAGVAGWEGWPLPSYPTSVWTPGEALRVPVRFYLPAALLPASYELVAGLIDPATGTKTAPVTLGKVAVMRRAIQLELPAPARCADAAATGGHTRSPDWV